MYYSASCLLILEGMCVVYLGLFQGWRIIIQKLSFQLSHGRSWQSVHTVTMLEDMSTPTHMPVLCPPRPTSPPNIWPSQAHTIHGECLTGGDNRIYLILALATFTHSLSLSLSPTPSTVLHCQQTNIIHSISPCVSTLFLAVFFWLPFVPLCPSSPYSAVRS